MKQASQRLGLRALPDVRARLRAAIREVSHTYSALPPAVQAKVDPAARDALEMEVNRAVLAGDRQRAERAIRAWRGWWLAEFERAAA